MGSATEQRLPPRGRKKRGGRTRGQWGLRIGQGRLMRALACSLLSDPSIIQPGGADPELNMHWATWPSAHHPHPRKTNGDKDLE